MITPQIQLGNIPTGQLGDSTAQAFHKFNIHEHNTGFSGNLLSLGIKPGFILTAISNYNQVFPVNTRVISVSSVVIEISNLPLITESDVEIIFTDPLNPNNIKILKAGVTSNSNLLITNLLTNTSGVPTVNQTKSIITDLKDGVIPFNGLSKYSVIINNQIEQYISKLDLICYKGNCQVTLSINTRIIATSNLTLNNIVSLDLSFNDVNTSTLVKVGDHVSFEVTGFTATPYINFNLYTVIA